MRIPSTRFGVAFCAIALLAAGCSENNATPAQPVAPLTQPGETARDAVTPLVKYDYSITNLTKVDLTQDVYREDCMHRTLPTTVIRPDRTGNYVVDTKSTLFTRCARISWFEVDYFHRGLGQITIVFTKLNYKQWTEKIGFRAPGLYYCKKKDFGKKIDGFLDDGPCP